MKKKESHLVSWQIVGHSMNQGGLEIGNLRLHNKALLANWLWHFALESESLRHRIILGKHGSTPLSGWLKGLEAHIVLLGKDISLELPSLSLG